MFISLFWCYGYILSVKSTNAVTFPQVFLVINTLCNEIMPKLMLSGENLMQMKLMVLLHVQHSINDSGGHKIYFNFDVKKLHADWY